MSEFFLKILNMSIAAGWAVLAVLIIRLLLKKAPKCIAVLLWGIVAIRLICPFSIESALSLIPSVETVSPGIMMAQSPKIDSGIPLINNAVNPIIGEIFTPEPVTSINPLQIWIPVLSVFWLAGIGLLLLYTAVSYLRLRRKIRTAVLLRDNIYQCETVVSPFVLGSIKPKIYLPFQIGSQDMEYVIAHEQAHIRRKDHLWKPIGFLLLTVHWFNPLIWLGYILLCRDIEIACDEKVVKKLQSEQRADYSQALLNCSVSRRMVAACPLAFGEVGVKERVKGVLNYKKPAFWLIVLAVVVILVLSVCLLTNPVSEDIPVNMEFRFEVDDVKFIEMYHYVGTPASAEMKVVVERDDIKTLYDMFESLTMKEKEIEPTAEAEVTGFRFHLLDGSSYELVYRGYGIKKGNLKATNGGFDFFTSANIEWYWSWLNEDLEAISVDMVVSTPEDGVSTDRSYRFQGERDWAVLSLSLEDTTCSIFLSILSSYWPTGTYEETEEYIVVKTDDGQNQYTFRKEGFNLIFVAEQSSEMPKYVYSSGQEPQACIPDGAIFQELVSDLTASLVDAAQGD